MRLAAALPFVASALVLLAATASAVVPSPARSVLPNCIHASMVGIQTTLIIVNDFVGNPVPGSVVQLDYSDCAAFQPCPPNPLIIDGYTVDFPNHRITMVTDQFGAVAMDLRAGGGCVATPIRIYADGVLLGVRRASSTDQNGDLSVDGADAALLQGKIGTGDLSGDLDCNGVVNSNDQGILMAEIGASCASPVRALPSTWGRVKTIYR